MIPFYHFFIVLYEGVKRGFVIVPYILYYGFMIVRHFILIDHVLTVMKIPRDARIFILVKMLSYINCLIYFST